MTLARKILFLSVIITLLPALSLAQGGRIQDIVFRSGIGIGGVNVAVCAPLATTAASVSGNLVTFTMSSNPVTAGFAQGGTIWTAGFTGGDTYLNVGTFTGTGILGGLTILSVTPTTIVATLVHANASAGSNGTILQMGTTIIPCGGKVTLYTDSTLSVPSINPVVSDGYGNFGYWVPPGQYYYQMYGPTLSTTLRAVTVAGQGIAQNCNTTTSGLVPTPPNDQLKFLNGQCGFTVPPKQGTGPRSFYLTDYGAKADANYSCVATMTSGSTTVGTDTGVAPVTFTSLTANVADISGTVFQVGDVITIAGTANGGGIFNVSGVTVTARNGGTGEIFFPLVHANVGSAADTGTVTGPSVDKPFINAVVASGGDIGDIVFGTGTPCADTFGFDFPTNTNFVPLGTIVSITDAHHAVVSLAATGTCTGNISTGHSCQLVWAPHDDTVALQNWFHDILNTNGMSGCGTGILPAGNIFFSAPIVDTTSRCGVQVGVEANSTGNGFTIKGQGQGQTVLVPSPALDASTAVPAGQGSRILFGSAYAQAVNFSDFKIYGAGNDVILNGNGKCILSLGWNSSLENVIITEWGMMDTQTNIALCSSAALGGSNFISNYTNNNGGARCMTMAQQTVGTAIQCLTFYGAAAFNGGDVYTSNSYFGGGSGSSMFLSSGASWNSTNDLIQAYNQGWCADVVGVLHMTNDHCFDGGSGGVGGGLWLDGGTAYVTNTVLEARGSSPVITANGSGPSKYFDGCGNSFGTNIYGGGGSTAVNPTNISFFGSCSVTGSPLVTGNLVLSANFGTGRATSAWQGATSPVSFTITNGSAAVGASPTVVYTFPVAYYTTPLWCNATQVGGTNAVGTFASSALSATGVTFTFSLTPTVNDTEFVQVKCETQ